MRNGQFEEYWVLLLITPGTFTGGPTDEVIAVESDTEAYHEWDSYRMFARSSSVSSTPRAAAVAATAEVQHFGDADPRIKVATIRQALRTFRFRLHFQGLLQELALYNQKFINQTSALKYDDLLRGLIQNVVGVQALTLEEQLRREQQLSGCEEKDIAALLEAGEPEAATDPQIKISNPLAQGELSDDDNDQSMD